jgi:hypothetical protein
VSESDYLRKHALECLRLAADSMQLAGDVQNPALQSHFVRMARVWSDLAVRGPNGDTRMESGYPVSQSKQTGLPDLPAQELRDRNSQLRCELAIICFLKA